MCIVLFLGLESRLFADSRPSAIYRSPPFRRSITGPRSHLASARTSRIARDSGSSLPWPVVVQGGQMLWLGCEEEPIDYRPSQL